ncbi:MULTISPECIES: hypothetical protein [Streptomyces]
MDRPHGTDLAVGIVGGVMAMASIAIRPFVPRRTLFVDDLRASGTQRLFLFLRGGRPPGVHRRRQRPAPYGTGQDRMDGDGADLPRRHRFRRHCGGLGHLREPRAAGHRYRAPVPGAAGPDAQPCLRRRTSARPFTFTAFFDIATGSGGQFVGGIAATVGGYRSAFAAAAMCSLVTLLILRFLVLVSPVEETLPDPEVVVLREGLSEK